MVLVTNKTNMNLPIKEITMILLIPVERNGVLPDVSARVPGAPVDHWGPCSLLCAHRAKKGPTPHCLSNNGYVKPLTEAFKEVSRWKNKIK